mgnify:CR=1 FL=1
MKLKEVARSWCDINNEFKKLLIVLYKEEDMNSGSYVEIYGDDKLIYRSPRLVNNDKLFEVVADVSDVSR